MCSQWINNYVHFYALGPYYVLKDKIGYKRSKDFELGDHFGEVAVISGGHRGLGAKVTKDLLTSGIHVIMGCRKVEDGTKFVNKLREEGLTSGKATILPLNLSSLESVKNFAEDVLKETTVINVLVNNAGIMIAEYLETEDKLESHWQVNYLSHFLLSHLLLPALQAASGGAKIVNVTSLEHKTALSMDYQDLNNKEKFNGMTAYSRSKLAQVMFTLYLNDKLKTIDSNVEVLAVHPGIVNTDIFDGHFVNRFLPFVQRYMFKTPEQGAKTIVYAALYGKGGEYIGNCAPESPSSLSRNAVEQQKLFEYSKNHLQITLFGNLF